MPNLVRIVVPIKVSWVTYVEVEADSIGAAMDAAKAILSSQALEIPGLKTTEPRPRLEASRRVVEQVNDLPA